MRPAWLKYSASPRAVKFSATIGKIKVKAATNCTAVDSVDAANIAGHCCFFKNTSGIKAANPDQARDNPNRPGNDDCKYFMRDVNRQR